MGRKTSQKSKSRQVIMKKESINKRIRKRKLRLKKRYKKSMGTIGGRMMFPKGKRKFIKR